MAGEKLSPMMEQYFEIKKQYPGMLLFYRLGDFYELFFDDAKLVSEELDLVLTGRDCGLKERAPMCGVPFHSADSYISKLIQKGYKIAICEQMEDPKFAKKLVKRDVIRVITPGTALESEILEDGVNNYLMSICKGETETGICFADVSTAEFHVTAFKNDVAEEKIVDELSSYAPKEILINSKALDFQNIAKYVKENLNTELQLLDDEKFDFETSAELILKTINKEKIGTLGIGHSEAAVSALGAVIDYLQTVQKREQIEAPVEIDFFDEGEYVKLDANARRNLELTKSMMTGEKKHSLLWVIDKTKTAMGKRMLRNWVERPLMSISMITKRQNAVGELADNSEKRDSIRESLSGVKDMERLTARITYGTANARELKALETTISNLPQIKAQLEGCGATLLKEIATSIDLLQDVEGLINRAIVDDPPFSIREGGMIKEGFDENIDELKSIVENGAGLVASVEARLKAETGIPKLKVGYNKVFGYYIEVTNSYKDMVPDSFVRKQTLTNCERFINSELKEIEGKVLGAKEKAVSAENEAFNEVRDTVSKEAERLQKTARAIAVLDALASLAEVAFNNNYVCPKLNAEGVIEIKDGRHPVVERLMDGGVFVPNDILLDNDKNRCLIITGPNMAGKSTYMRQTALIVLMAQIGSFVPAKSANIGVVDAIFTRVGASDDLATGQSTFMVEMKEVATILKNATKDSLIILDEIGRGTSTYDGMSIARAVLEHVCKKKTLGAKTLFATHYHELTAMQGELDGVKNFSVAVKKRGDDIIFLRRIVEGGADKSFGVEVAKLAGVPDSVVKRAKVILKQLEKNRVEIDFKADDAVTYDEEELQYNFSANDEKKIIEELKSLNIDTMTPIEALQILAELKKRSENI